jgi:ribosome modulation factor
MSDDESDPQRLDFAFEVGVAACLGGAAKADNPYIDEDAATAWARGWQGTHDRMMLDLLERQELNRKK